MSSKLYDLHIHTEYCCHAEDKSLQRPIEIKGIGGIVMSKKAHRLGEMSIIRWMLMIDIPFMIVYLFLIRYLWSVRPGTAKARTWASGWD